MSRGGIIKNEPEHFLKFDFREVWIDRDPSGDWRGKLLILLALKGRGVGHSFTGVSLREGVLEGTGVG